MNEPLPAPFFPPPPAPLWLGGQDKPEDKPPGENDKRKPEKERGPVRTQMVGESPGDDLGYDPKIIPTEKIPDQD